MKKSLHLLALISCAILMLGISTGKIHARLTGTTGAAETCWGAASAEVCVDTSGHWIPTVTDTHDLGTSSLIWRNVYAEDLTASDDLTVGDDLTVTGDFVKVSAATQTVAGSATISIAGACGGLLRIGNLTGNSVTTSTTDTFTAPSAANMGCILYVVNVGPAGPIVLDNNSHFDSPGAVDITLGTNDGAIVAQVGGMWVVLGTQDN